MDWSEIKVGDRLLIKRKSPWDFFIPFEVTVIEFSPSKQYVKVRRETETLGYWIKAIEYKILEKLEG